MSLPRKVKTKCFILDSQGNRKKEIPVLSGEKGTSKIDLKPEYKTVWYEIDIE